MTFFSLGAALRQLRRDQEAIEAYEKAVALDPGMLRAWINLAVSTERLDRARSLEAQAKVLEAEPENLVALNLLIKFHLQDCDFEACEAVLAKLLRVFQRELAGIGEWRILANMAYRALFVPVPVPLLRRITDRIDQLHLKSLTEFGQLAPLPAPDPAAANPDASGRKIRIGYMTPNFADHPVGHVTLQLFPDHDRERFEIHAIATHARRGGDPDYNKRHRHGVDYYHDLSDLPHLETARRIRNLGIDILVDLDGYMETASTAIMVFRPCPVQIYWMGHAGGLGLSFVDYLIADDIVVPRGEEHLYKEKILRLPECYHVASPSAIAEEAPSRADCGLPEDAFVFCAFNNPEKFNRTAFDAWMRILEAVPGSVLWVSKVKGVPSHRQTLRRQARERGIDPARLVFADRLPDKAEHFARHRHIGLFLDTLTLNASTTALDALWAGVPLLTVKGDRFSNRISNSMLHWIGLDDMIQPDIESYVARAIHLARHPEELAAIRERLQANRETMPLFQTARFAYHLEQAYLKDLGALLPRRAARELRPSRLAARDRDPALRAQPGERGAAASQRHRGARRLEDRGGRTGRECRCRLRPALARRLRRRQRRCDLCRLVLSAPQLSRRAAPGAGRRLPRAEAGRHAAPGRAGFRAALQPDDQPLDPAQRPLLADGPHLWRPGGAGPLQPRRLHHRFHRRLPEAGRLQHRPARALLRPLQRHEQRQALQPVDRAERAGDEVGR